MISAALHPKTFPVRLALVLALVALAAGAFNLAHQASGAQRITAVAAAPSQAAPATRVATGVLQGTTGNDALTAPSVSATIRSGAGSDTISATNGKRDHIDCGSGLDHVTADRADVLRNCEYVVHVES